MKIVCKKSNLKPSQFDKELYVSLSLQSISINYNCTETLQTLNNIDMCGIYSRRWVTTDTSQGPLHAGCLHLNIYDRCKDMKTNIFCLFCFFSWRLLLRFARTLIWCWQGEHTSEEPMRNGDENADDTKSR